MDEFIKKLIERLEEELKLADEAKGKCARENPLMFDNAKGYSTGIANAKSFVNELAEECSSTVSKTENNGWIACSERLPEDDLIYILTVEYPNNEIDVDYGWFDRIGVCWYVGMQEFRTSNVLAWQPLPIPYRLKGNETVTNCNALKMETADNEQI